MIEKISLKEYANKKGVSLTTVYRWIKNGKLRTEREGGVLYLLVDAEEWRGIGPSEAEILQELRRENDWLRGKVDELTRQLSEVELRHHEIVKGLIDRLEEQLKALAGVQQKQKQREKGWSWWWQKKE
jgi:excisionase family DNA binding protein